MCIHMQKDHIHVRVEDPVVQVSVQWIIETLKQPSMH